MEEQLRTLRIIHAAMLVAVMLYALIASVIAVGRDREINPLIYLVMAVVGASTAGAVLVVRQAMIGRALEALQVRPDDSSAIAQWRGGYILLFALCEAVALYGLVLQIMGATPAQAAPFYAVGVILLLLFYPRKP